MSLYAWPGAWAEHAACCHPDTPDMSMPERHGGGGQRNLGWSRKNRARIADAIAQCHLCPVIDECAQWALTYPDPVSSMIAGGMTPAERDAIRGNR